MFLNGKSGEVDPAAVAEDALLAAAGEARRAMAKVEGSRTRAMSTPHSQTWFCQAVEPAGQEDATEAHDQAQT